MSRLTATQVITLGEYLEPEFDPASLTISQLLGILGYHNIQYPTPYSKSKLVKVFNDEIKSRSAKFKKERLKRNNSAPSDDGIMDGVTGKPLTMTRKPAPTPRRSLRRSSQVPIEVNDDDEPAPPPDPPKRRRSSARPDLEVTSRRKASVQPPLAEESEPEDEVQPPPKKTVRNKRSSETARRISNAFRDDSGWEDNNIFQSGAESSSPARPSPVRSKIPRKSGIVRKSRKPMSAPPEMPDSSPARKSPFSPPRSEFNPRFERPLPLLFPSPVQKLAPAPASPFQFPREEATEESLNPIEDQSDERPVDEVKEEDADIASLEDEIESIQSEDVQINPYDAPNPAVLVHHSTVLRSVGRILFLLSILAAIVAVYLYKSQSAAFGFCDANSGTNNALESMRAYKAAVETCNKENRTELHHASLRGSGSNGTPVGCPLPPLIPMPHPDACTPCPRHGTCTQFSVQCDNGYLRKPHPLLAFLPDPPQSSNLSISSSSTPSEIVWTVLSSAINGLPGLGSIALPPRCVLDPRRQHNIGALGKAMESLLAQEKGRRLCIGGKELDTAFSEQEGGEARRWGVELETLRESMKRKTSSRLKPAFDDTFNEAVQELVQWGDVLLGVHQEDHRYLASKNANLTWDCVVTIKTRELWQAWRQTAFGAVVAFFISVLARHMLGQKRSEAKRVSELVQIALDTLRNQELAHHTDPVTTPHPYLSSIQLRDVILQNEHSIPTRRRLWDQVEHIVEGNANVRANLEEIEGGDELRVWRWVGTTGRGLP